MRIRIMICGLAGLAAASALAQPAPIPPVPEGEVRIYRVYYPDPNFDPETQAGIQALVHHESPQVFRVEANWQGEGKERHLVYRRSETLFNGGSGQWTFEFIPGPHLVLDRFEHTLASPAGKLLRRESFALRDPELGYPDHLLHPNVMEFAFRGLKFQPGQTDKLSVFLSPLLIYEMEVKVAGKEMVDSALGRRECWKVEMVSGSANYQGLSGLLLQRLSPTYTFWLLAEGSHPLIRYQGPLGIVEGVKPMKQIHELAYLRSAEYPQGLGQEPKAAAAAPRPAAPAQDPPFAAPAIPEEWRSFRVYFETPIRDLDRLPLNQQLLYRETANHIETTSRWIGEGSRRRLEYTRTEKLNSHCLAVVQFRFLPGNYFQLQEMARTVTNPAGERVREEYCNFEDPRFRYPADLCHPYTLELAYRSLELAPGTTRNFHLWLGATASLKMTVRVEGLETLPLDDGRRVSCYRLEMIPDLVEYIGVVGKLIQPIVPRYTWWLSAEGSHSQVRYRGPLGQINVVNAPVEVHDLLERKLLDEKEPAAER